jgi:hypothetical protein
MAILNLKIITKKAKVCNPKINSANRKSESLRLTKFVPQMWHMHSCDLRTQFLLFAGFQFADPIFCGLKIYANPQKHNFSPYNYSL